MGEKKKFIIINKGEKDSFKRWPFFDKLGYLLEENLNAKIIITGIKKEKLLLEKTKKNFRLF